MLYVPAADLKLIREYLGRGINTNDFVFEGRTGKPVQSRYLRHMVKRVGVWAGVAKDIHPTL